MVRELEQTELQILQLRELIGRDFGRLAAIIVEAQVTCFSCHKNPVETNRIMLAVTQANQTRESINRVAPPAISPVL